MASPPPPLRILRRISISAPPCSASGAGTGAGASLPLTFFDVAWLFTGPIERLFFYPLPHSTSHFVSHLLPPLASSLSLALLRFPPLLGRVRPSPQNPNPAADADVDFAFAFSLSDDSVPLTVAESSDDFDALSSPRPRDFANLHALVPQLPRPGDDGSIPLAAVQVTVFPRRGVALGIAVHHVACDDSSFLHFVKSWAAACKLGGGAAEFPPPPFLDRGAVPDPTGLRAKTLAELTRLAAHGPPPEPEPARPDTVLGSFSLGRAQIERLKRGLAAKARESGAGAGAAVHCSSFVVACAFAWVCLLRAQEGHAAQEKAHLLFSVECRARLSPPIPGEYFGNCLRPCFVEAATEALLEEAGGVAEAAFAIGEAIKGLGAVLEGAEGWLGRILGLIPARPMSVGGSPRFRVYDADFGWGRPRKVELLSIAKTPGTISLAESAAAGDDHAGGIEIGVVLPRHEMDTFRRCFSEKLLPLL